MRSLYGVLAFVFVFGMGIFIGTRVDSSSESVSEIAVPLERGPELREHSFDHLRLEQSSAVKDATNAPSAAVPSAENLTDPRLRAALEKNLREVPYAVLKQIYLERQDGQWQKQQERYAQPKEMSEEELDRRTGRLFDAFQRDAENAHYVSRGDLKLRGGKSVPYVALVEYYSSRAESAGASSATNGRELCYVSTLYLRIGQRYAADGQSSCLSWVAMRGDHPFAVHSNYNSKRLVPYFDSLSLALPGFGSDRDPTSEWYDSPSNRWTPVGRIRFESVSKDEYASISKETQLETDGE